MMRRQGVFGAVKHDPNVATQPATTSQSFWYSALAVRAPGVGSAEIRVLHLILPRPAAVIRASPPRLAPEPSACTPLTRSVEVIASSCAVSRRSGRCRPRIDGRKLTALGCPDRVSAWLRGLLVDCPW